MLEGYHQGGLKSERRGLWAFVAVVLTLFMASGSAPVGADDTAQVEDLPGPEDLALIDETELSPRLLELTFSTPALDHNTKVRVLVPDDFDPSGATRYPVLYLLHGGGDSYRSWVDKGEAAEATEGVDLIVVMPDNNEHGNYVDWYNGGAGGAPMWETYIIGQLVPFVDEHYPTMGTRDGRAVAGLSMGGGGAMGYATRHPDMFTAAAAFSGAVDTNTLVVQLLVITSGVEDGAPLFGVHGDRLTNEIRWRGHNPWDLAPNLDVNMLLHLRTGNGLPGGPGGDLGDPVELLVNEQMTNLHHRLASFGIDHVWDDYGPGGHNWFYWQRGLRQFLPEMMDRFSNPVPMPEQVTFRAVEPDYSVFGWDVSIDRRQPEWSYLVGASDEGFTLRGTGSAAVVTPPDYEPGETLEVEIIESAGPRTTTLVADEDGRVTVNVDLGRPNPYKQYTLQANLWVLLTPGINTWPVRSASVTIRPAGE